MVLRPCLYTTRELCRKNQHVPFFLNLGQTAEDSEMFTNIWLSSIGLRPDLTAKIYLK